MRFVDFTHQIFNRGKVPIAGLQLGTKCACEAIGTPPDKIMPGESAPISFRLRAPYVGKMQRRIPLLINGASEPAFVFDVSLRVQFEPPRLVPPPDSLSVSFVKGDRSPHELVFEAIEAKGEKPWIRGFDLHPLDSVEVQAFQVEELPEADPDLTRRRYHFPLVDRSLPIGQHMATATFQTRDGALPLPGSQVVWFNVVDVVAIVPNPLVIKFTPGVPRPSRRVRVITRMGKQATVTPVKYDRHLLRVDAAGEQAGSTAAFEVVPGETDQTAIETRVVFNIGGNETRELVVRFEPPERP
ncbi:MAG TPA: hypothetical protein PK867_20375 [Pirellulales bacterium]|nr:hypothetical protein [Pirellulales bacterium]